MELKDKTAIVTGVSKGIGLEIVKMLVESGMNVAGWGRTAPEFKSQKFLFVKTDIREMESIEQAKNQTISHFGSEIHVLVNNAGLGIFAKLVDTTYEDWHNMFDTNVHGLFYCTKALIPIMQKQQSGHIINIASIAATNGVPDAACYCATKHAVRGLSHSLFREIRKDNIKVSCIYPGSVNTNFFDDIDSVKANDTMLAPKDIATVVYDTLKMPDNFLTVDIEVRPMNPVYN